MWRKHFDAGLWSKEFRQVRMMLGAMLVLGFSAFPLTRMGRWWFRSAERMTREIDGMKSYGLSTYSEIDNMFQMLTLIMCILAVILSVWQIGYERRAGIQEFTFSLPYSRKNIYTTKWLLGVSFIVTAALISILIDVIVIVSSPLAPYMEWFEYLKAIGLLLLLVISSYTGSLFIGAVAGSWSTQIIFTGIMLVLPIYMDMMLRAPIQAFHIPLYTNRGDVQPSISYLLVDPIMNDPILLGISLILLIIVFFIGGMFTYERNRVENNGKLVNNPAWEKVLIIGVVICCGLLGGYIAYYKIKAGHHMIGYIVGFLLASAIGYFIMKILTRLRLKR